MNQPILFVQGGGEGAYAADDKLVASLRRALGASYEIRYPKVRNEEDPAYENWKRIIEKELSRLEGSAIVIGRSSAVTS